ncbi:MAG: transposase [Burkholderiaceae bacterium]|nr:transposase [Burkholderiaceae bacterium]
MIRQDTRAKATRRKHDAAFKRELIERSLQPGASVSAIALENGLNANLLFKWRRMHLRGGYTGTGRLVRSSGPTMLPVTICSTPVDSMRAPMPLPLPRTSPGVIEIDIGAARVRLRGAVDQASLHSALQTLAALR